MRISTRGKYGLIAIVDLAIHFKKDEIVTINNISERNDISKNYLEQIISPLRKEGIIKGIKGSQGGYILNLPPEKITVGEILKILEGDLFEVSKNLVETNVIMENVLEKCIWNNLNDCIVKFLNSVTIEDLVKEYKSSSGDEIMYYI